MSGPNLLREGYAAPIRYCHFRRELRWAYSALFETSGAAFPQQQKFVASDPPISSGIFTLEAIEELVSFVKCRMRHPTPGCRGCQNQAAPTLDFFALEKECAGRQ